MSPTTTGAMASASDALEILARLWCRAEGNDPDDTISDAGHTVLDALLSGLDRKSLAAIRQAETDLRAALAAPAPVVPEEVRRLSDWATQGEWYAGSGTDIRAPFPGLASLGMTSPAGDGNGLNDRAFIVAAVNFVRTLLAATPSKPVGDEPEASAPPAGGGAVEEDRESDPETRLARIEAQMREHGGVDSDDMEWMAIRARMAGAIRGISNDFMTSTRHHPGYVLIPTAKFEQLRAAEVSLAAPEPAAGGEREIVRRRIDVALAKHARDCLTKDERDAIRDDILSAPSGAETAGGDGWRNDPSADERWNAGLDYGQTQLCVVLGVDPQSVSWDAATETLDGDVRSVIGNILTAWAGDNWRDVPTPSNAGAEGGQA